MARHGQIKTEVEVLAVTHDAVKLEITYDGITSWSRSVKPVAWRAVKKVASSGTWRGPIELSSVKIDPNGGIGGEYLSVVIYQRV